MGAWAVCTIFFFASAWIDIDRAWDEEQFPEPISWGLTDGLEV
jgi:hypothetical protein